jgi:hypothetical protein
MPRPKPNPDDIDPDEPESKTTEKAGPYRKRTTDLHPLFGGSKTFIEDRRWRRDIPRAGDTEGGC